MSRNHTSCHKQNALHHKRIDKFNAEDDVISLERNVSPECIREFAEQACGRLMNDILR